VPRPVRLAKLHAGSLPAQFIAANEELSKRRADSEEILHVLRDLPPQAISLAECPSCGGTPSWPLGRSTARWS